MSAKNIKHSSIAVSLDCLDLDVVLKHLFICSSPNTLIMKYPNSLNIMSVPFWPHHLRASSIWSQRFALVAADNLGNEEEDEEDGEGSDDIKD